MTTPCDEIAGLIERLRAIANHDWNIDHLPGTGDAGAEAATQLDALSAMVKELEAERHEVREVLAGSDYGSLPNDWTLVQVADARMDNISKLRWQVRDTCSRAEAAEARATRLQQERDELRDAINSRLP